MSLNPQRLIQYYIPRDGSVQVWIRISIDRGGSNCPNDTDARFRNHTVTCFERTPKKQPLIILEIPVLEYDVLVQGLGQQFPPKKKASRH